MKNSKISLRFEGEDAVGDGVTRDAFSAFIRSVYNKFDGEFQRIPSNLNNVEELKLIGEIFTHGFIVSNVFPLQICKASLKYYLFESCTNEELFHSFMRFIPEQERTFIENWDGKTNTQRIIDLFSEYGVYTKPTLQNLQSIVVKVSNIALIRQPCFPMQTLIRALGNFWNRVSVEMIDALYESCEVNSERFIAALDVEENCPADQKTTTWLHRYLRNLGKSHLSLFLRFITGSECLAPSVTIKVNYVNQEHKCPTVQTCFKILSLSRQYNSFFELRESLNKVIESHENWSVHDAELEESSFE